MKLPINKIILGDCLKIMPTFPDESIDMIFTDPPYGVSSEVNITRTRDPMKFYKYKGKDISHDFGEWDKFKTKDEFWTGKKKDECICPNCGHTIAKYKRCEDMICPKCRYQMMNKGDGDR